MSCNIYICQITLRTHAALALGSTSFNMHTCILQKRFKRSIHACICTIPSTSASCSDGYSVFSIT